jgi:cytochrome c nitrite reductase small subunit
MKWKGDKWRERISKKTLLILLIGVFAGIAAFSVTATTLQATDTAEFCSGCHVMGTVHESFKESNHAHLNCNDCHAPRDSTVSKMTFKARAGLGHIYMNTLGSEDIPDVLHATAESEEVLQRNCVSCHEPSLRNIDFKNVKDNCMDCHRQVPHGNRIYKPDEWHQPQSVEVPPTTQ